MDHVVGFSLIPEFQGRIRRGVAWADEDIPVVEVFGVNIVAIKHGVPDQEFIVAVTYAHGGGLFTLAFVGIHFQRVARTFPWMPGQHEKNVRREQRSIIAVSRCTTGVWQ